MTLPSAIPPYQETMNATSDNPVYDSFMDAAFEVADKVELITPARFLFNAGKTKKAWNAKMLADKHLKVKHYEPNSAEVFSNTDIKGGVVITYRDATKDFGAIEIFTRFPELNSILKKVKPLMDKGSISDVVYSPESYKFTDKLHTDHPEVKSKLSKGHAYDITSNIFDKLSGIVFFEKKPDDGHEYILISGRKDNARTEMWIKKDYVAKHENLDKHKVLFPKTNGSGMFGEVMSSAIVTGPGVGHTQTFISMGALDSKDEALALNKYVRSKFTRTLLGILKVTQDNKKSVWKYVPLQDFTDKSDIDWNVPIKSIDRQLYKKYNLTDEEIEFIETHVKEMD